MVIFFRKIKEYCQKISRYFIRVMCITFALSNSGALSISSSKHCFRHSLSLQCFRDLVFGKKNLPVNSTSLFLLPKKFIFASSNTLKWFYLLGKPSVCVIYFNSLDKATTKSDINILYISLYYIYICIIFIFHILHWVHGGCGRSAENPYSS